MTRRPSRPEFRHSRIRNTAAFAAWALVATVLTLPTAAVGSNNGTSGAFDGCPTSGEASNGGTARDPALNELKNRSAQQQPDPYQVAELIDKVPKPSDDVLRQPRAQWSHDERALVLRFERTEAQIVGYLFDAKPEGPEQPNCGAPAPDGDYHVWLIAEPSDDRTEAAVVEVTPRWRATNPGWAIDTLRALARSRERVRITGWMLFDQEHPEQLDRTRGTLWELHPITKIEVFRNGSWQELEDQEH